MANPQLDRMEIMLSQLVTGNGLELYRGNTQRLVIEMLSCMADNRKIEAIKILRQITGMPLKESKDAICNAMIDQNKS